jgi:hypothetical protein
MPPRVSSDPMTPSLSRPKSQAAAARASIDHAQKVKAAVEGEHGGGPMRAELVEENQACRQENAQLWDWLFHTIERQSASPGRADGFVWSGRETHGRIVHLAVILNRWNTSPTRAPEGASATVSLSPARSVSLSRLATARQSEWRFTLAGLLMASRCGD